MMWKLIINQSTKEQDTVFGINSNGQQESCSITAVKYLEWLSEGNTPEPADPLPIPVETYSKLKLIKYLMANGAFAVFKQFLLDNGVDNYFLYAQDLSSADEDVQALFPALLQMLSSAGITITEEELKNIIKLR